ncbi:hypothetical protein [Albirhodobacter sp. R86504]|jgi:hypothetical protein|uniref:hypothetical protein n=1 Tax=Albirhodobacter sp. R86504 TaxID=3093848 RepID=UPI003672E97D
MKKSTVIAALVCGMMVASNAAFAGAISKACLKADRRSASNSLCTCIQQVADQSLSRSDQRRAAKFFKDPHQAQEIRQSSNRSDEAFWLRYKAFGERAGALCTQ